VVKVRSVDVNAGAFEWDALGDQVTLLPSPLGKGAISANDAPPGQVGVVALEEDGAGKAGRAGRDVTVGADEPLRDRAHALEHFELAGFGRRSQAPGPKASMMRFWYSESSSGEMK
jgi:hypothetical protein